MSELKRLAIKAMTTWSGCRDKTGNVDLPTAEQALGEEVALFAAINEQNVELAAIRAENAELKQKIAAIEAAPIVVSAMDEKLLSDQAEIIEALKLQLARLVDALKTILHGDDTAPETMRRAAKDALSSESDNQWLREKQAEVLELMLQQRDIRKVSTHDCALQMINELRNPSPESDIDQATRQT